MPCRYDGPGKAGAVAIFAEVWRKLRWSVAQRGVRGSLTFALARLRARQDVSGASGTPHPFDAEFGTDTGGVIGGGSLAVGGRQDAFITAYAGVPPARLLAAVERWQSLPGSLPLEQCTFVDIGCGKGRALLLASTLPFREVLGVELNGGLVRIAERNLAVWRASRPVVPSIRIECGDATELTLPPGPCLVYLYNAFATPVLREFLGSLERQVAAGAGPLDLIYQNESPDLPLRSDPRLTPLWGGTLPLTPEQAAVEPVSSPEDLTGIYRWTGAPASGL